MRPTRLRLLIAIGVMCAALGWGTVQIVAAWFGRLVPVPWLAAGALWLVAGALAWWTVQARPRLRGRPDAKPMEAIVAARSAALAMAASRIGAVMAGFYAGVAVGMVGRIGTPSGSQTLWAAVLATGGALGLVAAALWLEQSCRIPLDRRDDDRLG